MNTTIDELVAPSVSEMNWKQEGSAALRPDEADSPARSDAFGG